MVEDQTEALVLQLRTEASLTVALRHALAVAETEREAAAGAAVVAVAVADPAAEPGAAADAAMGHVDVVVDPALIEGKVPLVPLVLFIVSRRREGYSLAVTWEPS